MTKGAKECSFCFEIIKATVRKYCYCSEFLDGHTRDSEPRDNIDGDTVGGDKI